MNNLITNQSPTMSSREIAELTGKEKKTVHRDIKTMCDQLYTDGTDLYHASKFGVELHHDARGYCEMINLDRKHTDCLLTGYSAKARMKVIERWYELEKSARPQLPQTMAQALQLAADQAFQLEAQAPKVAFVDKYVDAGTGNKTFREVCKLLQAKENAFREFLKVEKVMHKINGSWVAYACHIDAGRFTSRTGVSASDHAFNTAYFTPKGVQWVAGKWAVYQLKER